MRAADQRDDVVKNGVELATLQDFLPVALRDVEDGIACCHGHLWVLIDLQALGDWCDHLVEELHNRLMQLVVILLREKYNVVCET